jgi:hypothetical protein
MKRRERSQMAKRFSPVLPALIGGSVLLIIAGTLFTHAFLPVAPSRQGFVPTGTQPASAFNAYSIPVQQAATSVTTISGTHGASGTATPATKGTPSSSQSPTPGTTQGTTPTPVPTSPPGAGNPGTTLPPGSALPSESACAARVTPAPENRPDNTTANHQVPTAAQIANLQPWTPTIGMDSKSDSLRRQITGNYTGTTDEILQWVACKWGIDVNIVRAEAVQESHWHQNQLGDYTTNQSLCPPGTWNGSSCYQSYGILQIKYTYFKTEWPMSQQDTAFNAEFVYGWIRNCYEGWTDYLYSLTPSPGYPSYHAGDIWGCLGFWFSGGWYTSGAINYINIIKQDYQQKPWLQQGF